MELRRNEDQETDRLLHCWEDDPATLSVAEYQRMLSGVQGSVGAAHSARAAALSALIAADFRRFHAEATAGDQESAALDTADTMETDGAALAPIQRRMAIMAQIGQSANGPRRVQPWRQVGGRRSAPLFTTIAAAAALVVALTVVLQPGGSTASVAEVAEAAEKVEVAAESGPATLVVRFELADAQATSVALAGTFTDWSLVPLTPTADGVWFVELKLVPNGTHTYNFVIDNQVWIADPTAVRRVRDDFGGEQSVLFL